MVSTKESCTSIARFVAVDEEAKQSQSPSANTLFIHFVNTDGDAVSPANGENTAKWNGAEWQGIGVVPVARIDKFQINRPSDVEALASSFIDDTERHESFSGIFVDFSDYLADSNQRSMSRKKLFLGERDGRVSGLPEFTGGPPQPTRKQNQKQCENCESKFTYFSVAEEFVAPGFLFPVCILCVVASLYFIRIGLSQFKSGRWFGLFLLWGGTVLAWFSTSGFFVAPAVPYLLANHWGIPQ
jgi:hypothetical protein